MISFMVMERSSRLCLVAVAWPIPGCEEAQKDDSIYLRAVGRARESLRIHDLSVCITG
jgi:hypothetical protein